VRGVGSTLFGTWGCRRDRCAASGCVRSDPGGKAGDGAGRMPWRTVSGPWGSWRTRKDHVVNPADREEGKGTCVLWETKADRSDRRTRDWTRKEKDTNVNMPYRPPHAREGAGGGHAPPTDYRPKGYGGGSSFGTTRGFGGDARGAPPSTVSSPAPPTVFPKWKPSERVSKFTEEQIKEVRTRMNVTVDFEDGEPLAPPPIETFEDMNLHEDIIQDIRYHDYEKPTPIQTQGIPVALSGRDILGCAQTGSGKTASFAIPMIQHCLNQPPIRRGDGPLAVVLAPTRELAQQIEQEVKAFSRTSKMRSTIVVGGTHMGEQRTELRAGVEIVVATPGRFIDHLHQGNTYLDRVSFIVLDEADRMLDMGFEPQILEVMKNLPKEHQTLLFSATMPPEVEELAGKYLNKPVRVKVGTVSTPTASVTQHLIQAAEDNKIPMLLQLCLEEQQAASHMGHKFPLTIIFVERKNRCDEVADALEDQGLSACSLHGGKTQQERESALRDFRTGRVNICVATDVASRGLDVTGIDHVINLDLPRALEDYVHRIGRTGRAGASGRATSYYTERDSFIVGRIKFAISQAEKGNAHAFATGREARQKEREERAAFHGGAGSGGTDEVSDGIAGIKVDDQYKHMAVLASASGQDKTGAADDAWGDDEDDF